MQVPHCTEQDSHVICFLNRPVLHDITQELGAENM